MYIMMAATTPQDAAKCKVLLGDISTCQRYSQSLLDETDDEMDETGWYFAAITDLLQLIN